MIANAPQSRRHPILAQIVPIRRCYLACGYCNEFDKASARVPLAAMRARIDRLAALGTAMISAAANRSFILISTISSGVSAITICLPA
jgi:hypothetical protein